MRCSLLFAVVTVVAASRFPHSHLRLSLDSLTKERYLFAGDRSSLVAAKEATSDNDENILQKTGKRIKDEVQNVPKFVWGAVLLTLLGAFFKDKFLQDE